MDLLIKHCFYIQQVAKQLYISPGQVQLWYRLTHIIPCCETGKESIQKGIDVLLCFLQENENIWCVSNCTCSCSYITLECSYYEIYSSSIPICFLIASRMLHTMNTLSTTDKAESIRLKTFDISLLRRIGTAITLDINPK